MCAYVHVCVRVRVRVRVSARRVCVCVCVFNSAEFDIGHCLIKLKFMAGLLNLFSFATIQTVTVQSLAHGRKL